MLFSERGNGFLEMMLFTPLAIFFLFFGLDCGFSLHERSVLQDAIRSGLHAHALTLRDAPRESSQLGVGTQLIETPSISSRSNDILAAINQEIATAIGKAIPDLRSFENLRIDSQLIIASLDPQTGALKGFQLSSEILTYPDHSDFSLRKLFPELSLESREQFATTYFNHDAKQLQSQFAAPLVTPIGNSHAEFLPQVTGVLVEVTGSARGLPGSPFRNTFQNIAAIQEFAVIPLRRQLG